MTTEFVDVEGGRLAYERAGEGYPVVLLHPGLWDSRIWEPQFAEFAEQHDVVRYDLRGHGRSDPPNGPYSNVGDLLALLEALKIDRCALVGCALGAQLAIDFALERPEIAEAVVAVSPYLTGYAWRDEGYDALEAELERTVRDGDLADAVELELAVWTPPGVEPETDELIHRIATENAEALRMDPGLPEQRSSALADLERVRAAMLVIVGFRDVAEIHRIADMLVDRVPGATKRVIAEADHLVNVRRPAKFNRLVLDFLSFRV